jgi:hypothetical protein
MHTSVQSILHMDADMVLLPRKIPSSLLYTINYSTEIYLIILLIAPFPFYMDRWMKSLQSLLSFLYDFLLALPIFLPSSSTWLNHLVLGRPMSFFPSDYNFNAFLDILVLSILFTYPKHCSNFSSNTVNNFGCQLLL